MQSEFRDDVVHFEALTGLFTDKCRRRQKKSVFIELFEPPFGCRNRGDNSCDHSRAIYAHLLMFGFYHTTLCHDCHKHTLYALRSQSQEAGITLSSHSFRGGVRDDQDFASEDGMSDVIGSAASLSEEFKLWLSRHPGLSIDEARHRYRDEQKAKNRRKGLRF